MFLSDLLRDEVLVWGPYLLSKARPSPCCFHAIYLLQCRHMAFHLTYRRIDYPSTNLWRCSYQVTYLIIITIFIAYSHPELSRRHRTTTYISSSARWRERARYNMAFYEFTLLAQTRTTWLSALAHHWVILRCRSRTRTLGWLSEVATGRRFLLTSCCLQRKLKAHICITLTPVRLKGVVVFYWGPLYPKPTPRSRKLIFPELTFQLTNSLTIGITQDTPRGGC